MTHVITLPARAGADDGYLGGLPLDRDLPDQLVVDAQRLASCHPMLVVRLRLFLDWHRAAGKTVRLKLPVDAALRQSLANLGLGLGLEDGIVDGPLPDPIPQPDSVLPLRRIRTYHDVEDAAFGATELLHAQVRELRSWGDAMHTAVGELGDNALQHGDARWAYLAADRVQNDHRLFRLAIVDLGIGIPEHIRDRHPEWQDDTAAITRVLQRGVTGTDDPERGNGYAEVIDKATQDHLVRARSSATLDIRSGKGHVKVELVGGLVKPSGAVARPPRRGTWLSYTVASI